MKTHPQPVKSTKAAAVRAISTNLASARQESDIADRAASAAKAELKVARKKFKKAKKAAKEARRMIKVLKRGLKQAKGTPPARVAGKAKVAAGQARAKKPVAKSKPVGRVAKARRARRPQPDQKAETVPSLVVAVSAAPVVAMERKELPSEGETPFPGPTGSPDLH